MTRNEVLEIINNLISEQTKIKEKLINENTILKEKIQKLENKIQKLEDNISQQTNDCDNHISLNNKLQHMYDPIIQSTCDPIIQSICDKQNKLEQQLVNIQSQNIDNNNNTFKKIQQQIYDIIDTFNLNNFSQIQSVEEIQHDMQHQLFNLTNMLTTNTDKINNIEKSLFNNNDFQNEINTQLSILKEKFDKTNIEQFTVIAIDKNKTPIFRHYTYLNDDAFLNTLTEECYNGYKGIANNKCYYSIIINEKILKKIKTFDLIKRNIIISNNYVQYTELNLYFSESCDHINDKITIHNMNFNKSSLRKLLEFLSYDCNICCNGFEEYNGKTIRELILS